MNKRIKEFAEQSGFRSNVTVSDGIVRYPNIDTKTEQSLNKFAELIIQECSDVSRKYLLARADRSYLIHKVIKDHFMELKQ
jgi:hypothetical protein